MDTKDLLWHLMQGWEATVGLEACPRLRFGVGPTLRAVVGRLPPTQWMHLRGRAKHPIVSRHLKAVYYLYTSRSIQPIIFFTFQSTLFLFLIPHFTLLKTSQELWMSFFAVTLRQNPEFVVGVFDPFVWFWSILIKNLGFGQALSLFFSLRLQMYCIFCDIFSLL